MKEKLKSVIILALVINFTIICMFLLTGCASKEEAKEDTVQNTVENTLEESITEQEDSVNEKYGLQSKTSDENITVNLDEDPRPESFKMIQAVEKNLKDEGYVIDLIDIGGYGTSLSVSFKLRDNSSVSLVFSAKDTLYSIVAFSDSDLTLIPIARTVVETDLLNISEEERIAMLNATDYTKIGDWSGYIGDSQSKTPGRLFTFSKSFKSMD